MVCYRNAAGQSWGGGRHARLSAADGQYGAEIYIATFVFEQKLIK
ncbi:protein of unknown function (plasmid) [Cupriavidus taiwanensis]|uniref:Uncharacterized protein n=1 Tax=Cupriavidus taiwanensis TaxID=164546 RepID=A0A375FH71_9BURK|nr:protein of unknown function [Cupriavidus taiwanensis]SOZ72292.1 protein of unknown function [Cupriavidus taiwanensis]SPA03500.1 protein of unknown function [Cupriavidus taiwanensis]SPA57307.1 protein of unknown function [Cupriavidus taiwanensis]SPD49131.1 protein of unknown function [Cupriavidus taiwanensis]